MNYHGTLSASTDQDQDGDQGGNYGYPFCHAAWNTSIEDAPPGLVAGEQFSMFNNATSNDTACQKDFVRPRLTFRKHVFPFKYNAVEENYLLTWSKVPHQAPLDIIFSSEGDTAYISFHGSVDEADPKGYLVGSVAFDSVTGQPTRAYDSYIALDDIIQNADDNSCPSCMRPVGLALLGDRVLFSSDVTGEIYILDQSTTSSSGHDKTIHVAIGVSVAFACVVMILGGFIYWRWRRSRQLLGAHTSGPGSGSMSFGGLSGRDENKSAGIQLTQRKSRGRSSGAKNPFQDRLQRQTTEQSNVPES